MECENNVVVDETIETIGESSVVDCPVADCEEKIEKKNLKRKKRVDDETEVDKALDNYILAKFGDKQTGFTKSVCRDAIGSFTNVIADIACVLDLVQYGSGRKISCFRSETCWEDSSKKSGKVGTSNKRPRQSTRAYRRNGKTKAGEELNS